MNPRRKTGKRTRQATRTSAYMHLWPELEFMPALDHWPDRSKPYDPEHSQVLAFIVEGYDCDLLEADKIFQSARSKGVVRFDSVAKLWCGVKGGRP